mmetsp:Transcript_13493/g.37900  ORF Transcript_13493/g.37900 Transcript_13493/m.37900 type:complete len:224 (+) Transcript_13493:942-1613(+)
MVIAAGREDRVSSLRRRARQQRENQPGRGSEQHQSHPPGPEREARTSCGHEARVREHLGLREQHPAGPDPVLHGRAGWIEQEGRRGGRQVLLGGHGEALRQLHQEICHEVRGDGSHGQLDFQRVQRPGRGDLGMQSGRDRRVQGEQRRCLRRHPEERLAGPLHIPRGVQAGGVQQPDEAEVRRTEPETPQLRRAEHLPHRADRQPSAKGRGRSLDLLNESSGV